MADDARVTPLLCAKFRLRSAPSQVVMINLRQQPRKMLRSQPTTDSQLQMLNRHRHRSPATRLTWSRRPRSGKTTRRSRIGERAEIRQRSERRERRWQQGPRHTQCLHQVQWCGLSRADIRGGLRWSGASIQAASTRASRA
jgi:hypothetical protein